MNAIGRELNRNDCVSFYKMYINIINKYREDDIYVQSNKSVSANDELSVPKSKYTAS